MSNQSPAGLQPASTSPSASSSPEAAPRSRRRIALIIAAILVPALAALFVFWSLHDRTDRLDQVRAAVVNLDEGTEMEVDGEQQFVPLGRLLAGVLTQPETVSQEAAPGDDATSESSDAPPDSVLAWELTDRDSAEEGLEDGTYTAILTIPEDFSGSLATLGTPQATQARVDLETNDASSPLISLLGGQVTQALSTAFGQEFTNQYLSEIYLGFNELQSQFQQAADGAQELGAGANQLAGGVDQSSEGAAALADGTDQLAGGAGALAEGVGQSAGGALLLADGADQVSAGVGVLANGVGQSAAGASQLAAGTDQLAGGAGELASGAQDLSSGAAQLSGGIDALRAGIAQTHAGIVGTTVPGPDGTPVRSPGLLDGARQLSQGVQGTENQPGLVEGSTTLAEGTAQLRDGVAAFDEQTAPARDALTELVAQCAAVVPQTPQGEGYCAALSQAAGGLVQGTEVFLHGDDTATNPGIRSATEQLALGTAASAQEAPQLVAGIGQLTQGLAALGQGTEQLLAGATPLADGAGALAAGTEEFAAGAQQLSGGAGELAAGQRGLADGLGAAQAGAQQLSGGAGELAAGQRGLADGLGAAQAGAQQLSGGAGELAAGQRGLADGLGAAQAGTQELSGGADDLAAGQRGLADGLVQLQDGAWQLADGTQALADGLTEGASEVPTYSEAEREAMAQMGTQPVTSEATRYNEISSGSTLLFPVVAAVVLWLGALASFLIMPALRRRYLNAPMPAWEVVARSALPALIIGLIQAALVLILTLAFDVSVARPLAVIALLVAGAVSSALVIQAIVAVCGPRLGFLLALVVMVLQAAALGGLLPIVTAPDFFQALHTVLPLPVIDAALTRATLGAAGSVVPAFLLLLAWAGISYVISMTRVRSARGELATTPVTAAGY